jgi:hypothetical protein
MNSIEVPQTRKMIKNRKWIDLRDSVALAMMSLASFLIETTLGLLLLPFIPFPLMGGLLSGFLDGTLIFLANYMVPRRGGAMLFAVLLLTMSTITPSFGPIGAYKVLIGFGLGLVLEILLLIIGRSATSYIVAVAVAFGLSIPMTFEAWKYFGIPGASQLKPALPWITLAYTVLGAIAALFGSYLYNTRLKKHMKIRKLREG